MTPALAPQWRLSLARLQFHSPDGCRSSTVAVHLAVAGTHSLTPLLCARRSLTSAVQLVRSAYPRFLHTSDTTGSVLFWPCTHQLLVNSQFWGTSHPSRLDHEVCRAMTSALGRFRLPAPHVYLIAGASLGGLLFLRHVSTSLRADKYSNVLSLKHNIYASIEDVETLPYPPDAIPGARDVESPYGSIRVYEWGPEDGEKILLIHGISTPSIALTDLANKLVEKGCRVMLFGRLCFRARAIWWPSSSHFNKMNTYPLFCIQSRFWNLQALNLPLYRPLFPWLLLRAITPYAPIRLCPLHFSDPHLSCLIAPPLVHLQHHWLLTRRSLGSGLHVLLSATCTRTRTCGTRRTDPPKSHNMEEPLAVLNIWSYAGKLERASCSKETVHWT